MAPVGTVRGSVRSRSAWRSDAVCTYWTMRRRSHRSLSDSRGARHPCRGEAAPRGPTGSSRTTGSTVEASPLSTLTVCHGHTTDAPRRG
jgi:hypothetical protein